MKTVYYYKGKKILHTTFIAKCNAIGIFAGKKSYMEQLKYTAQNGKTTEIRRRCENLLRDIKIGYEK